MSFWFVASVAFAVLFDTDGFALYGLLAAVLHECGHIAAMCCWKTPPKSIHCGMCCIDIEDPARGMRGYRRDIGVLLAGPLVNMIAGAILFLPSWWCQSPRFMTAALTQGVTAVSYTHLLRVQCISVLLSSYLFSLLLRIVCMFCNGYCFCGEESFACAWVGETFCIIRLVKAAYNSRSCSEKP